MTLLTFVLAGIYSLMIAPSRSLEINLASVGSTQAVMGTYKMFSLDLAMIVQPSLLYHNAHFDGSPNSVSFTRQRVNASQVTITYVIIPSEKGKDQFVLLRKVESTDDLGLQEEHTIVLNDTRPFFEFWDNQRQSWVSGWNTRHSDDLPSIIRLNLSTGKLSFPIYQGRVYTGGNHET